MDIKQAERIAREHGGKLLGYHTIPFPVYQILVSYETFDDDPFFPIKKALLKWILERQDTPQGKESHIKFVASMLGMDYRLLNQVYHELKDDNLIVPDPVSGVDRVTDDAKRNFIQPESRPSKQVTGTVILDGKTFDFLPPEVYAPILDDEVNIWEHVRYQNVEAHMPIDMSADSRSPEITRMENELDRHKMRLDVIGLRHREGWGFKITGIEKRNISPVFLVYVGKDNGKIVKLPYIGDVQLATPAIGETDKFTFSIIRRADTNGPVVAVNLGYNSNDDTKDQCIGYSMDGCVQELVRERYNLKKEFPIKLEEEGCFWRIDITEDMLESSLKPGKIISDCLYKDSATGNRRPCLLFNVNYGSEGMLVIEAAQDIDVYLEIQKAIQENRDEKQLEEKLNSITPDWRKKMITMGQYSKLEDLDIIKYITPLDLDKD